MKEQKWTDLEIIRALKGTDAQREAAWSYIFHQTDWRLSTLRYILKNSGDANDAADIFQETAVKFEENIRLGKFEGNSSLKTYFFGIQKNRWLKTLESRARRKRRELETMLEDDTPLQSPEQDYIANEKNDYRWKMLAQIGERCEKIMRLASLGHSGEEIAREVGLNGGADAAKKEKNRCRIRILQFLQNNPEWKNHIK